MYMRGTRRSRNATMALCVVLLFIVAAIVGCRDGENTAAPAQPLPYTLNLPIGTRFAYNTWTLDQTYPQLPPVKTMTYWQVLATQQH